MGCRHSGIRHSFIINSYIEKSKNLVNNKLEELQGKGLIYHITNKHKPYILA